jgi:hypothetical protein
MTKNPKLATGFIAAMVTAGLAILLGSASHLTGFHVYQFGSLLLLGAVTSRTKVKLPGVTGTMSVNLPFILIAASQLSLFEAATVALVSATLQSLPKRGGQFQPSKILFNASTIVLAAGASALLLHSPWANSGRFPAALVFAVACGAFLLVNTLPVATIISLTEGSRVLHVWSSILHLSFPYYVACTGVTFMVTFASQHVGWQAPLLVLPIMLLIYRCYQRLFEHTSSESSPRPKANLLARAAAAH